MVYYATDENHVIIQELWIYVNADNVTVKTERKIINAQGVEAVVTLTVLSNATFTEEIYFSRKANDIP